MVSQSYSLFSKHSTRLYWSSLFSFSFLASHPQSIPVASANQSTAALIPVAVVICSMVSPSPFARFLVRVVGFFAVCLDSFFSIFDSVKN